LIVFSVLHRFEKNGDIWATASISVAVMQQFTKIIPVVVLALCITALGLFGSGDATSEALKLLCLLVGSRVRF
jgi:hypothetical protein